MHTFTQAKYAMDAAESLAVIREQTIAIIERPEGYGVIPESERRAKRIIERVHPVGETWDWIKQCVDWLPQTRDLS